MPKINTTHARIADLGKPRIVIIGSGFGGLEVARGLGNSGAQILRFDHYNYPTFHPLFNAFPTSWLETSSIVVPFMSLFRNQPDVDFRTAEVTGILPTASLIENAIRQVPCDYRAVAKNLAYWLTHKAMNPFRYADKGAIAPRERVKVGIDMKAGIQFRWAFGWHAWRVCAPDVWDVFQK